MKRLVIPAVLLATLAVLLTGCGSHRKLMAHYTTAAPGTVPSPDNASTAISAARASNPSLFSIFPALGAKSCLIPAGGPVRATIPGSCETRVRYTQGPQIAVLFIETWRGHGPSKARHVFSHTWQVIETTSGKVLNTRSIGDFALQLRR